MKPLRNIPIRNKLVAIQLLIATLVTISCATIFFINDYNTFRDYSVRNVYSTARMLNDNAASALAFFQKDKVTETLQSLTSQDNITHARVFDMTGQPFADYAHEDTEPYTLAFPDGAGEMRHSFVDGHIILESGIYLADEKMGTLVLRSDMKIFQQAVSNNLMVVGFASVGVLLLALSVALLLQGSISRPILKIVSAMQNITQTGDYSQRIEDKGKDELHTLSEEFNKMLGVISSRNQELKVMNASLESRVEERTKQLAESNAVLREQSAALARQNKDLRDFTYAMSHDLKSPIRAIGSLSDWIAEEVGESAPPETQQHFKMLKQRIARLSRLIEALLEYSAVDRSLLEISEINLETLIRQILTAHPVKEGLEVHVPDGLPTIMSDERLLRRVIFTLIENASDFHDKKTGNIWINLEEKDEFYTFSVTDDGPGIAPEYFERIFRIFQTLESRDKHETTGAGLAICKRILNFVGGSVKVESGEAGGTKFVVAWPKSLPEQVALTEV